MRVILLALALLAEACAKPPTSWTIVNAETRSQLQIREMQSRTFPDCRNQAVLKALIDVLQDDGFIVKNAVLDLGLVSATKEVDISSTGDEIFQTLFLGDEARWKKNSIIEATANVTQFGHDVKVRVSFQGKIMNNRGEVEEVETIAEAKYYQEFFAKVDKGLFIQRQGI